MKGTLRLHPSGGRMFWDRSTGLYYNMHQVRDYSNALAIVIRILNEKLQAMILRPTFHVVARAVFITVFVNLPLIVAFVSYVKIGLLSVLVNCEKCPLVSYTASLTEVGQFAESQKSALWRVQSFASTIR